MKKLAASLLLGAFGAAASAAPTRDFSIEESRRIMSEYGLCVVRGHHEMARKFVLAEADGSVIPVKYQNLIAEDCMGSAARHAPLGIAMRFSFDMYRYAMADALVTLEFRDGVPAGLAAAAPLRHREVGESANRPKPGKKYSERQLREIAELRAQAIAYSHFSRFGECVVRADPDEAHRLLMAKPNSIAEAKALTSLAPIFSECLVADQDFAVNRLVLRGTIALNFYRLAMASRGTAQGATH